MIFFKDKIVCYFINWGDIMKNKVVALSGYPGSGKTTVGMKIIENGDDFVYFDFGTLFRPLTYYL